MIYWLIVKWLILTDFIFVKSYAIGGLSGGEDKDSFWRVVAQCTAALPEDKPRYVMVQLSYSFNTHIFKKVIREKIYIKCSFSLC